MNSAEDDRQFQHLSDKESDNTGENNEEYIAGKELMEDASREDIQEARKRNPLIVGAAALIALVSLAAVVLAGVYYLPQMQQDRDKELLETGKSKDHSLKTSPRANFIKPAGLRDFHLDTPSSTRAIPVGWIKNQQLLPYVQQKIQWKSCGSGYSCAQLEVPMDYENPGGQRLKIALKVWHRAGQKQVPNTSENGKSPDFMLINPGGPGGSGVELISNATQKIPPLLHEKYFLLGFDPRGVGESSALKCLSASEIDELNQQTLIQQDPAGIMQAENVGKKYAQACQTNSGDLIKYLDTEYAARDLEIMRVVLGQDKLNYLGFSYGTFLGATYASFFPQNVGKMILDGAVNPQVNPTQMIVDQASGFEATLGAFHKWCTTGIIPRSPDSFSGAEPSSGEQKDLDGNNGCPLAVDEQQAFTQLFEFISKLDTNPLPTSSVNRSLGTSLAITGILTALYHEDYWVILKQALKDAMQKSNGSILLQLADISNGRQPNGAYDNSGAVNLAVNCLDFPLPTSDRAEWLVENRQVAQQVPFLGRYLAGWQPVCMYWPRSHQTTRAAFSISTATPVIVIGNTHDPATPYKWSQALHQQLHNSVLLTKDSWGHTALLQDNGCLMSAIEPYINEQKIPLDGFRCA